MTFSNSILSGTTLVRAAMKSEGFQTGVSGWQLERNGNAELNNVTVRGEVQVGSGVDFSRLGTDTSAASGFTGPGLWLYTGDPSEDDPGGVHQVSVGSGASVYLHPSQSNATNLLGIPYLALTNEAIAGTTKVLLGTQNWGLGLSSGIIDFFIESLFRVNIAGTVKADRMRPEQSITASNINPTNTSFAGNGLGHSFIAPASGAVAVDYYYSMAIDASSTANNQMWGSFRLGTAATVGSGSEIFGASTTAAIMMRQAASEERRIAAGARRYVDGLTPGDTYNVETQYRVLQNTSVTHTIFVQQIITAPVL